MLPCSLPRLINNLCDFPIANSEVESLFMSLYFVVVVVVRQKLYFFRSILFLATDRYL